MWVVPSPAAPQTAAGRPLYVGKYKNNAPEQRPYGGWSTRRRQVASLGLAAETDSPSWVVVHPNKRFLYAANELPPPEAGGPAGAVTAFSIDSGSGTLTAIGRVKTNGLAPAHMLVDPTGKWAIVGNYGNGAGSEGTSIAVFAIGADGKLADTPQTFVRTSEDERLDTAAPHPRNETPGYPIPLVELSPDSSSGSCGKGSTNRGLRFERPRCFDAAAPSRGGDQVGRSARHLHSKEWNVFIRCMSRRPSRRMPRASKVRWTKKDTRATLPQTRRRPATATRSKSSRRQYLYCRIRAPQSRAAGHRSVERHADLQWRFRWEGPGDFKIPDRQFVSEPRRKTRSSCQDRSSTGVTKTMSARFTRDGCIAFVRDNGIDPRIDLCLWAHANPIAGSSYGAVGVIRGTSGARTHSAGWSRIA